MVLCLTPITSHINPNSPIKKSKNIYKKKLIEIESKSIETKSDYVDAKSPYIDIKSDIAEGKSNFVKGIKQDPMSQAWWYFV